MCSTLIDFLFDCTRKDRMETCWILGNVDIQNINMFTVIVGGWSSENMLYSTISAGEAYLLLSCKNKSYTFSLPHNNSTIYSGTCSAYVHTLLIYVLTFVTTFPNFSGNDLTTACAPSTLIVFLCYPLLKPGQKFLLNVFIFLFPAVHFRWLWQWDELLYFFFSLIFFGLPGLN